MRIGRKTRFDRNTRKGFTLTELLTTTAVIGVLASLMLPAMNKVKNKARDVQCLNNQRNIRTNLESTYTDVSPDYNTRWNNEEGSEFVKSFFENHTRPLLPDPTFKDIGGYMSKPLTCPFAWNNGETRVPFSIHFRNWYHDNNQEDLDVKYITYNYNINFWTQNSIINRNEAPQVTDTLNIFDPYNYTFKKGYFSNLTEDRPITYRSRQLHPHKGEGAYVTYGNGSQLWIKAKGFSMGKAPSE